MNNLTKAYYFYHLNSILTNILFIGSLIYLNNNSIYITEQKIFSYDNNSLYFYLPYMLIFYIGIYVASKISFKSLAPSLYSTVLYSDKRDTYQNIMFFYFFILILSILIFFSYVNILISGEIPLLSNGYINRHEYLESTKLWFILKYFGSVQTYIPIILGYFLLNRRYIKNQRIYIIFLFAFYILYIILIGNKFGALRTAFFMFLFPLFIAKIINGERLITYKFVFIFITVLFSIISLIVYHYINLGISIRSSMSILEFIFYRIFALQGHVFWGVVNYIDNHNTSVFNLWLGMENLMILLYGSGIYSELERGVRFSGGFPAILFISVPLFFNYLFYTFFIIIYFTLFKRMINNLHNLSYLFYCNILIVYNYFLGMGTLSVVFSYKMLLLIIMLTLYLLTIKISNKKLNIY